MSLYTAFKCFVIVSILYTLFDFLASSHILESALSQDDKLETKRRNIATILDVILHSTQRSSIGAVGVRLCSSARLAMPLEFVNLNLLGFNEGAGQPLTAAWLYFMLKYGCQAPIAANAHVGRSFYILVN